MKNINWKVRLQSGPWWMGVISSTVIAVFALLKIFKVEMSITLEEVLNVATLILMVPASIGIISDPTTKGIADSAQALNYEKPKDDQQLGGGSLSFNEWVNKYLGKKTDWDGVYGVQCVDLIDAFIDRCLGLKKGFWGNAKNWWTERNSSRWLKNNFKFVVPTYKNGELQPGDIGIRTSGAYGHIFIVKESTSNGKIKYYDQNYEGTGAGMTLREKPYTSVYINGVLRPKNQSPFKISNSYKVGCTYTLTSNVKVRTGAGTNYSQKKRRELTVDGQKNSLNQTYAVLKSGTKVTAQQIKTVGSDVWIRIPSGWIAAQYKGDKYVK